MGNKLSSCSCGPLVRKTYRYEDSPWQLSCKRRDGHLLRLWAEVFHVSASSSGNVKWQQVSEDLVPVNITCIQDTPECVFHITAYNSQVDKILDVRLVQPGTRIGQASECFVYWKDSLTNDTWGLNFTSPIDAKQFRECCSPSFKFSRKASSSYSLKLDPPNKNKVKTRRKPLSTPASPSRSREPQCTCMTADQYARLRAQDPRFRAVSTLPRMQSKTGDVECSDERTISNAATKVTGAATVSNSSLYDNVGAPNTEQGPPSGKQTPHGKMSKDQETGPCKGSKSSTAVPSSRIISTNAQVTPIPHTTTASTNTCFDDSHEAGAEIGSFGSKTEGMQAGSGGVTKMSTGTCTPRVHLSSVKSNEYLAENEIIINTIPASSMNLHVGMRTPLRTSPNKYVKSDFRARCGNGVNVDSNTLKRMLKPMPSLESPITSPETSRRRYHYHPLNTMNSIGCGHYCHPADSSRDALSEPEMDSRRKTSRISGSRSTHDVRASRDYSSNRLYLDLEHNGSGGSRMASTDYEDNSPPSDNDLFDNQCYATTPSSSSNGNSDLERQGGRAHIDNQAVVSTPGSPTSRLLLEYEMHLRNTLARGMDAESYSLHTFEALLTQSMENLEFAEKLPQINARSPHPNRRRPMSTITNCGRNTLPSLSHRLSLDRQIPRGEREGYYCDKNELFRDRGYLSDREYIDRGYLSDHNFTGNRCNSCLGGSSRSQWFRHSDGWRSGTSTLSSMGSSGGGYGLGSSFQEQIPLSMKRSAWESLPSLRHENAAVNDAAKLARCDSLERRVLRDRHDCYHCEREGCLSHQTSVESTDSKLCYLTSSEYGPTSNPLMPDQN